MFESMMNTKYARLSIFMTPDGGIRALVSERAGLGLSHPVINT